MRSLNTWDHIVTLLNILKVFFILSILSMTQLLLSQNIYQPIRSSKRRVCKVIYQYPPKIASKKQSPAPNKSHKFHEVEIVTMKRRTASNHQVKPTILREFLFQFWKLCIQSFFAKNRRIKIRIPATRNSINIVQ